ncbi:MAG: PDZ domain-containing protein [Akkermansiaceae bacterium]|jgi:serine protease Do|nr:PDZ domain-containing protein [Akkermansiaceae bacterium]MDG1854389.1 PDZ domain-containing protein [Verrucomicrobiales bacterium]
MKSNKQNRVNSKLLLPFSITILFCANALAFTETEQPEKAWLGIATAKVEAVLAAQLDLPEGIGAAVKLIIPDSPAEKSGIKKHDIIFEIDGEPIKSPDHLSELISSRKSGTNAELSVIQRGAKKTISVNFVNRPDHLKTEKKFADLEGLDFDILPFEADQDIQKQIQKMQEQMRKHLKGMFDLQDFDKLPGRGDIFGLISKTMMFSDDQGTIEIRKNGDSTNVIIKDLNGKITFEGPANTGDEKEKLPQRAKNQLNRLDESGLSFEGFNFGNQGIKIPKLKPGNKVKPLEGTIPPAKKNGKKIQL